jgi:hypothetical protein
LPGSAKFWIGIAVSAVFLALFIFTVDLDRFLDALSNADYRLVVPAAGIYLVSVLFRTLRWQLLLRHLKHVGLVRLYPVVVVGYMANNLLPMRIGEVVRSYYISKREGISKTASLVTIFIERLLDALTLLVFISVIALFVPVIGVAEGFGEQSSVPWPLLIAGITLPFVLGFAGLVLIAFAPARVRRLAKTLLRPLPQRMEERADRVVDMFLGGLISLSSPRRVLGLFLLSVPIWLFEALLFLIIAFSFDLDLAFDSTAEMAAAVILVTAIANIGASVPAAPGGIGLFELIARETLVLLPLASVDRADAGAYVTVVHATLLLPMIVLGQVFLWTQSISLRSLSRAGRLAPSDGTGGGNVAPLGVEPTARLEDGP